MDESVLLQMCHSQTDVMTDAQKILRPERSSSLPEEVQQAAKFHEFSDQINGLLLGTNSVQLHQITMRQIPVKHGTEHFSH